MTGATGDGERALVVVTGAAGTVGRAILPDLAARYRVRAVDLRPVEAPEGVEVRQVALRRRRDVRDAVAGADVVVHLAVGNAPSPRTALRTDPGLVRRVLDEAERAGARRVVLASSNRVVAGYEADEPYRSVVCGDLDGIAPDEVVPIGVDWPPRPIAPYGIGKLRAEALGREAAARGPLSVICLRLGTVSPGDRCMTPRDHCALLTHRDAAALVVTAIDAPPDVEFSVVFGVSANRFRIWDPAPAAALGFRPVDDAATRYDDDGRRTGPSTWVRQLLELSAQRPFDGDIDRMEHALQTATRAQQAGAREPLVVAALLHDVGVVAHTADHGRVSAAVIAPYLPRRETWAVRVHGDFTTTVDRRGIGRRRRYRWLWHPGYSTAARLADEWDAPSRGPDYPTLPYEHFAPLVARQLGSTRLPPWRRVVQTVVPESVRRGVRRLVPR